MKSFQILLKILNLILRMPNIILLLLIFPFVVHAITNSTSFWREALNKSLNFESYSGYEQIDWYYPKGTTGMFYQLFGAHDANLAEKDTSIPLFIWLQGGPGASSLFGAFTQIGPIRFESSKPKLSNFPWNMFGHYLFIDQPLNVGFSFHGDQHRTDQVFNTKEAVKHLLNFISNFYRSWPNLQQNPLYITGESFAGHFIPVLAKSILQNATFIAESKISLKGLIIGDGFTDPINQINFFDSMLYSAGIVSNKFRDTLNWFQRSSILKMYESNYRNATMFYDFIISNESTADAFLGGMSKYNVKDFEPSDDSFGEYLEKNKASFGVRQNVSFVMGNDELYTAFDGDVTVSYTEQMIYCLEKLRVLMYNGQFDFVVNTAGVLQYLNSLNWYGLKNWQRSKKQVWTYLGRPVGWVKNYGNLWFALVNKAGHFVPLDQPRNAFNLVSHFLRADQNWKE